MAKAGQTLDVTKQYYCLDFWGDYQEEVQITTVATDISLPSVTVSNLPSSINIVRVVGMFKCRMIENTNATANKLSGSQNIQVRKATTGTWTNAIGLVDDLFGIAALTRESGDVLIGGTDISGEVSSNNAYNTQWASALADVGNLNFNDVQVGLRVWYYI